MKVRLFLIGLFLLTFHSLQAQECGIFYVTPTGSGTGTRTSPAGLTYALTNAGPMANVIRMAVGIYSTSEPIIIPSGIHLEGGFEPADNWIKKTDAETRILRTGLAPETNPLRIKGLSAVNASGFSIREITVEVRSADPNNTGYGVSLYGIYLNNCSDYHISRCKIITGNAADGEPVEETLSASDGAPGINGGKGCRQCDEQPASEFNPFGGNGGNRWSAGTASGGKGGNGGGRGEGRTLQLPLQLSLCPPVRKGIPSENGIPGGNPHGPPTQGGNRGADRDWTSSNPTEGVGCSLSFDFVTNLILNGADWLLNCPTASETYFGKNGTDGTDGARIGRDGRNGSPKYENGYFIPGDGESGENGFSGSGGGGGGGGGAIQNVPIIPAAAPFRNNWGSPGGGGGGGGEGGQGGRGGLGGKGGGGNFGIFLWNNGSNGYIRNCVIQIGNAGTATAGKNGTSGGRGGSGGTGGYHCDNIDNQCAAGCEGGRGGNGGKGGNGAAGGNGGNGADGLRLNLYQNSGGVPVNAGNVLPETLPVITAKYSGFTRSEIKLNIKTPEFGKSYTWNIDNIPQPLNGSNIRFSVPEKGFKTVVLNVDGSVYTYRAFLHVHKDMNPPVITLNPPSGKICSGESLSMSMTADPSDTPERYHWRFEGQGIESESISPSFTIPTLSVSGKYTIKGTIKYLCSGQSDTVQTEAEVIAPLNPKIFITAPDGEKICEGTPVKLLTSVTDTGETYEIRLLNESGQIGTQNQAGEWVYSTPLAPGTYNFTAQLFPRTACVTGTPPFTPAEYVTIEVLPRPTLNCPEPAKADLGNESTFNYTLSVGTLPVTYEIDFGNGFVRSGMAITNSWIEKHTYGSTGEYPVILKITDADGCTALCTVTASVVAPDPNALPDFTHDPVTEGCDELTLNFNSNVTAAEYEWNFGDGVISTVNVPNIAHTFRINGRNNIFSVGLRVKNTAGIWSPAKVKENLVQLYRKPKAIIQTASDVLCAGKPMLFSNRGTDATGFEWDFGDGTVSNLPAVFHTFQNTNDFTVSLRVTNFNGKCSDQITLTVSPFAVPKADFEVETTEVCAKTEARFLNKTVNNVNANIGTYRWDFGDRKKTESTANSLTHTYTTPGKYNVLLTVITVEGCEDIFERKEAVTVLETPEVELILNEQTVSETDTTFVDAGTGVVVNVNSPGSDERYFQYNGRTIPITGPTTVTFEYSEQPILVEGMAVKGKCREVTKSYVRVRRAETVSIPNVFTPNGDGLNDIFNVITLAPVRYSLRIYDRWGNIVYSSDESSSGWNGFQNNGSEKCPEGAYVYSLEITFTDIIKEWRTGTITLLR